MTSPLKGEVSGDVTPRISGQIRSLSTGSSAWVYLNESCDEPVGFGEIREGSFEISNINFANGANSDGVIKFFGKIVNAGNTESPCLTLDLEYTLNTVIPPGSAKRFRLSLRDDPSTTMVVGWESGDPIQANSKIYFDSVDYGRDISSYKNVIPVAQMNQFAGMTNMFARLSGLQADTPYYFVVADEFGVSDRYWFKTSPNVTSSRLSIVAGGDSRNNQTARRLANTVVKKLRPHFVYFGGDMTSSGTDEQWQEWFDDWQMTIGDDGRITPIVTARGNHESSNQPLISLFDTPDTVYYALTFGGGLLRAYVLNSEVSAGGLQTDWLSGDLQGNANTMWKTAIYHRLCGPIQHRRVTNNRSYDNWAPLFMEHKVKLVVESDAHVVKSTFPILPNQGAGSSQGFIRNDADGITFVGEGCWGAPLRANNDDKDWTMASGSFNQVKWVMVDSEKIEVRTVRVENAQQVEQLTDDNIFRMPGNINLWKPASGEVITITK